MKSAYNGQMPYTNYTHDFTGIIDYVFYSASFLTPIRLLGPIGEVRTRACVRAAASAVRACGASACRPPTTMRYVLVSTANG